VIEVKISFAESAGLKSDSELRSLVVQRLQAAGADVKLVFRGYETVGLETVRAKHEVVIGSGILESVETHDGSYLYRWYESFKGRAGAAR